MHTGHIIQQQKEGEDNQERYINKFIIMETEFYTNNSHLGRKIERIRRLRGMTQTDLGELLGVTKQAISKMEQSEKIDDDKLKQVADALGVTEDGLKKFTEETVLYSTNNFYENCHVSASNIGPITHVENLNHFSMEQAVKLFEELLKIEREKYSKGKEDSK
jgi:transcriptional regulator with XRE-family HTH domain